MEGWYPEICKGTPTAKAITWINTDVEGRKHGEQTGLDTLVVRAVNDECSTIDF